MLDDRELEIIERIVELDARVPRSARLADERLRPPVDVTLVQRGALEHPNARVRRDCLNWLDHHANDESVTVFRAALADPVPRIRRSDARAPSVLDVVARTDPDPLVRRVAVAASEGRGRDLRSRKALRRRDRRAHLGDHATT